MRQKKVWSYIGLLIIALVVSIPFYVADVYATANVQIIKNQGSAGIPGFIDADGDTWEVEALVAPAANETVQPERVKVKIGSNSAAFDSCSGGALGTTCKYLSSLNDGIIPGAYDFSVEYTYADVLGNNLSVSDASTVKADGTTLSDGVTTALKVDFKSVQQNKGQILLDFTVEDQPPAYCSGLSKIEISETNLGILQTITNLSGCSYDFKTDSNGVLNAALSGEGRLWFKVKATDRLGHETTSSALSVNSDFVSPVIDKNSLVFVSFGKFIGQYEASTDLTLNVTEAGKLSKVTAASAEAKLDDTPGSCVEGVNDTWTCTWKNVLVTPAASVSITFTAEDDRGNTATETISQSFVVDSTAPAATFFGTVRTYQDTSYVSGNPRVDNTIVLKATETGAGISKDGVRGALAGLGKTNAAVPDYFDEDTYEARWGVSYAGQAGEVLIGLSKFEDRVGNEGSKPAINVEVDSSGPIIERAEIYGVSDMVKNYFQSNDLVQIDLTIRESSGLLILVDLNRLVMDAEANHPDSKVKELYPENENNYDYSGWIAFTEADCDRNASTWKCSLQTPAVKSGPDSSARLKVEVYDTAGNPAVSWEREPQNIRSGSKGSYTFDLLGLETEESPDYWEVRGSPVYSPQFIDLDTVKFINTRVAAKIPLVSDKAIARKIDVVGCTVEQQQTQVSGNDTSLSSSTLSLSRTLLYGGEVPQDLRATPILILEFEAFDPYSVFGPAIEAAKENTGIFEKAAVPVTCQLMIYSQVGKKALRSAELQEIKLDVNFGFSELGAKDENLEKRVQDIKDEVLFTIADKLSILNTILEWLRYLANFAQIILSVTNLIGIIQGKSDAARVVPLVGTTISTAICGSGEIAKEGLVKTIADYVQIPLQILSCQPSPNPTTWYGKYQQAILGYYNVATGRAAINYRAGGLYDNMYLSLLGLCVPGMIYNLEKYRQIRCREIICYQKEVPQGIATVGSCQALGSQLICEHFLGPLFQLTPLGIVQVIFEFIKSWFQSPVGLIQVGLVIACASICPASGAGTAVCTTANFIINLGDIINAFIDVVKNRPDITSNYYCGQIED